MLIYVFILCLLTTFSSLYGDWAESRLKEMTLEEKIGQLFIMPACQLRGEDHRRDLYRLITTYHIGGIILKQGTAQGQRLLINSLQAYAKIPLLAVQDAEWGLRMRLSDTLGFPKNLTLGAITDSKWIYQLGKEIGKQSKLVGVQINLAPCIDINSNPQNPIIHMRSFGEEPARVANHALALMHGMQSEGVAACAKHFPGHGDTSIDSHCDLPLIPHALTRMEAVEFFPFRKLIEEGVFCVMTAHLSLPLIAEDKDLPATLSRLVLTDLLRQKLHFEGVIISDALNMQALRRHYSVAQIALKAYAAGNDLLLYGDHIGPNVDEILRSDLPIAFAALRKAFEEKQFSEKELDQRVLKLLRAKEKLGLCRQKMVPEFSSSALHTPEALALKRELFRHAVTLVQDPKQFLPLDRVNKVKKVALIEVGKGDTFEVSLKRYLSTDCFAIEMLNKEDLTGYAALILAFYDLNLKENNFGLSKKTLDTIAELSLLNIPLIVTFFDTPYAHTLCPEQACCLIGYEKDRDAEEAIADVIFGILQPQGKLPIHRVNLQN